VGEQGKCSPTPSTITRGRPLSSLPCNPHKSIFSVVVRPIASLAGIAAIFFALMLVTAQSLVVVVTVVVAVVVIVVVIVVVTVVVTVVVIEVVIEVVIVELIFILIAATAARRIGGGIVDPRNSIIVAVVGHRIIGATLVDSRSIRRGVVVASYAVVVQVMIQRVIGTDAVVRSNLREDRIHSMLHVSCTIRRMNRVVQGIDYR
jgi:hypothetical protein